MTKHYARDSDIIGTSEYKKLIKEVRIFFIKRAKYLQISMPVLENNALKSSSSAWKTPIYVRWIVSANAKVPKGHNWHECS